MPIFDHASNKDIWQAAYDLVARAQPSTPPTAFANHIDQTLLRPYSSTPTGSEQTHKQLAQRILKEIHGRVYEDVGNFYQRYFAEKEWSDNSDRIIKNFNVCRENKVYVN